MIGSLNSSQGPALNLPLSLDLQSTKLVLEKTKLKTYFTKFLMPFDQYSWSFSGGKYASMAIIFTNNWKSVLVFSSLIKPSFLILSLIHFLKWNRQPYREQSSKTSFAAIKIDCSKSPMNTLGSNCSPSFWATRRSYRGLNTASRYTFLVLQLSRLHTRGILLPEIKLQDQIKKAGKCTCVADDVNAEDLLEWRWCS